MTLGPFGHVHSGETDMNNWRRLLRRIMGRKDLVIERMFCFEIKAKRPRDEYAMCIRVGRDKYEPATPGRMVRLTIGPRQQPHDELLPTMTVLVDAEALYTLAYTVRNAMPENDDDA
jgi:hypothetical protein